MSLTADFALDELLVNTVLDQIIDPDNDRFVHLVTDDNTDPGSSATSFLTHFSSHPLSIQLAGKYRFYPRNILTNLGNPRSILEVTGMQLKFQVK